MKKSKAQKDILYISISSFILVVLWVGFNIYHQSVDSTITPDLQAQIEPIDPKFDTATIAELKNRKKITPSYESAATGSAAVVAPISQSPGAPVNSSGSGTIELLGE